MTDKKVTLSIRLDPQLHEEVRRLAYEQRRSINSIVLEAIARLVGYEETAGEDASAEASGWARS